MQINDIRHLVQIHNPGHILKKFFKYLVHRDLTTCDSRVHSQQSHLNCSEMGHNLRRESTGVISDYSCGEITSLQPNDSKENTTDSKRIPKHAEQGVKAQAPRTSGSDFSDLTHCIKWELSAICNLKCDSSTLHKC